jgi:hypothetical protein
VPYLPPLPPGASPPTWLLTQDDLDRLPQVSYTSPEGAHDPQGCEAQADALRAEVARLTALLDDASRESDRADDAVAELETLRETLGRTQEERREANRRAYEAERTLRERIAEADRPDRADSPHSLGDRRPRLDRWPDDAVTLTYPELRALVALHLDRYCTPDSGRAMREGDVPLRLAEVLDR